MSLARSHLASNRPVRLPRPTPTRSLAIRYANPSGRTRPRPAPDPGAFSMLAARSRGDYHAVMVDAVILTPLFQASEDTFLKCDFLHPGRSHKARVARALIEDAEDRQQLRVGSDQILLERTGGNLGIALAIEARLRGYQLTLVTDPHY